MKNNKFNSLQFVTLLIAFLVTSFLGIGIYSTIKVSEVDSYFSVIIGGIFGILLLLLFIYIFNYEPDLPINKKIIKIFGNTIGKIINIFIILIALLSSVMLLYNLNNFIVSQFLNETPFFIVGLFFCLTIYYINIKGIETITRTSLILIIINLILLSTAIMGLIPTFELDNLKPILANGISKPIYGTFYIITLNISPIFFLLMIPKNSLVDKNKTNKYLIIGYIISFIIMFSIMILIIGCLGIHLATNYQYPEYMILKRISLFNFLDRVENIIIVQWMFGIFISISFLLYYITNSINNNKNSKLKSLLLIIFILIVSTKIFENNTIFNNFSHNVVPYIRLILIIIFIIIGITIKFKKKKDNNNNC